MAQKHILSLGFDFPAGDFLNIEEVSFRSSKFLCDADIIILQPGILDFYEKERSLHLGKTLLTEEDSFVYLNDQEHWQQELNLALEHGKNIFIKKTLLEMK